MTTEPIRADERDGLRTELEFERARLAEVQGAIHRLHARNDAQGPDAHGLYGCVGCDDGETWPCPTIQALTTAVLAVEPSAVPVEGSGQRCPSRESGGRHGCELPAGHDGMHKVRLTRFWGDDEGSAHPPRS